MNLGAKVKVNSSFGLARFFAKTVGSRGVFHFDPTPVDKWAKSLIYNEVGVGSRGSSVTLVTLDPTPT